MEDMPIVAPEFTPLTPENQPVRLPLYRSTLFLVLLGLILGVGLVGGFYLVRSRTSSSQTAFVETQSTPVAVHSFSAELRYLSGEAWKLVDGRKVELKQNDVLSSQDTILTSAQSRAMLEFDDGSIIRLDQNTQVSLGQLDPNYMEITNQKGVVYARVQKDPTHQFIVMANTIKVASLGTSFAVENQDQVAVKVFESNVNVIDGTQQTTNVRAHEQWSASTKSVTVLSSEEVKADAFLTWNVTQDQEPTPKPTAMPSPTPTPIITSSKITLKGAAYALGVILEWSVSGDTDISKGFKVVKNTSGSPKYPGDEYNYISDPGARRLDWQFGDGKEWHFRVCQYLENGQCGVYSNEIVLNTYSTTSSSEKTGNTVSSLSLQVASLGDHKAKATWSINGNSPSGFKVVWSKNADPTYPTRDGDFYHYLDESGSREDIITDLETGVTYHVRVCEYVDGRCGVYSNQQTIKVD